MSVSKLRLEARAPALLLGSRRESGKGMERHKGTFRAAQPLVPTTSPPSWHTWHSLTTELTILFLPISPLSFSEELAQAQVAVTRDLPSLPGPQTQPSGLSPAHSPTSPLPSSDGNSISTHSCSLYISLLSFMGRLWQERIGRDAAAQRLSFISSLPREMRGCSWPAIWVG